MRASVILAHPYPKSFNHALFQRVRADLEERGVSTYAHDLYAERFNPVLTTEELGSKRSEDPLVNRYVEELILSDFLFFVHPNWWGQPPAIMKGYIDRVIRPPHAYDFPPGAVDGDIPEGRLTGKCGIVLNTSNTPAEREAEVFGDPLARIWKDCVFAFCGIEKYYRKMFRVVAFSDQAQREQWLEEVDKIVDTVLAW